MAHVNLAFDRPAPAFRPGHHSGPKWPFCVAVPAILAASACLWIGIIELGAVLVRLAG